MQTKPILMRMETRKEVAEPEARERRTRR